MPRAQKVKTANWLCPTQKKKLSVCLQGESPIALPSLRRRSTDEQNLRLRAQNQGSALRARGLPGHNRLDRAHAVRRAVDAGRDDARVCRDGEPRAEGARTARRREGRGSRSWSRSSCFDVVWRVVCCCASARAPPGDARSHVASHWWCAPRPSVRRAASYQFLRVFFASKLVNTDEN